MNNEIVVIYKKVGEKAEFKKIQNDLKVFENLVGGELDYISYKDITIIANKDRKKLNPNIYLNTTTLNIRERNIKGNIVITSIKNGKFKSLSKDQAMKYRTLVERESFNYGHFNENGKAIRKNNDFKNKEQLIIEKEIGDTDIPTMKDKSNVSIETSETLKMLLGIQAIILKFIKNNES